MPWYKYAELYELDLMAKDNNEMTQEKRLKILEERLSEYLYDVYFRYGMGTSLFSLLLLRLPR